MTQQSDIEDLDARIDEAEKVGLPVLETSLKLEKQRLLRRGV